MQQVLKGKVENASNSSSVVWYFAQHTGWSAMSFVVLQKDRKKLFFT